MSRRQIVAKATRRRAAPKPRHRQNHLHAPPCACLAWAFPVPGHGLGFGVSRRALKVRRLILHVQTGYCVDPDQGQVYGRSGEPIGGICADGYVRLHGVAATAHTLYAHRLVWEVCNGPIPDGFHVDHKNAVRSDNRSRNLQAITPSQNCQSVYERGGRPTGEGATHSKLTTQQVLRIRSHRHIATRAFARMFNVDPSTVRAIRQGKTWRRLLPRKRRPTGKRKD